MSDISEAAKTVEALTCTPSSVHTSKMSRKERHEQALRVKRFLSFPPELQEGVLRYGEQIQKAYLSKKY